MLRKNDNNKILVSLDVSTEDFISRVTTNNGTLTFNEIMAVDYWIKSYKKNYCDDGITPLWDKVNAYIPLLGGTQNSCSVMVKWNANNITFTTGGTFSNLGWNPNGTAYGNTGIIADSIFTHTSSCISAYTLPSTINTNTVLGSIGCSNGYTVSCIRLLIYLGQDFFDCYRDGGGGRITRSYGTVEAGLASGTRNEGALRISKNGLTTSVTTASVGTIPNLPLLLGRTALGEVSSSRPFGSFFIGQGFTVNEESKRNIIEYGFQRRLGRGF